MYFSIVKLETTAKLITSHHKTIKHVKTKVQLPWTRSKHNSSIASIEQWQYKKLSKPGQQGHLQW